MVCRCCISGGADLSLFGVSSEAVSYAEMLRQCCSLEIMEADGKTSHICLSCSSKLVTSFKFREMCIQSDALCSHAAQRKLINHHPIKEELSDVNDSSEIQNMVASSLMTEMDLKSEFETIIIDDAEEMISEDLVENESKNHLSKEARGIASPQKCDKDNPIICRQLGIFQVKNEDPKYTCEYCSKSCSHKEILEEHMKLFHPTPYMCDICIATFRTVKERDDHRAEHKETKQTVRGQYGSQCEMCNKRCYTRKKLKEHLEWVHQGIKYHCELCDNYYTSESRHKELKHGKGQKCAICSKDFATKAEFKQHLNHCHKDLNTKCTCGVMLSKNAILSHKCSFKIFVCQYCAKIFKSSSNLNIHLKVHTKERPLKCDTCSKSFSNKGDLNRHMKRHTNLRDIKCDHCSSMFRTKKDLRAHITCHDVSAKRYACAVCSRMFRRSDHRNNHQRNVHGLQRGKRANVK